ncbi:hypothetical protein EUGRSUZ_F02020 [Eucalyptus grandis]|uniref:Uncharacterized protein n=2 Tax=Eucalyptus grandis TaxID=71139 RepID=A0ACC3KFS1_EUCGR|nr:hypothetical protein EUGRSUZ_F02020 [Eucalyptus grandis]
MTGKGLRHSMVEVGEQRCGWVTANEPAKIETFNRSASRDYQLWLELGINVDGQLAVWDREPWWLAILSGWPAIGTRCEVVGGRRYTRWTALSIVATHPNSS